MKMLALRKDVGDVAYKAALPFVDHNKSMQVEYRAKLFKSRRSI